MDVKEEIRARLNIEDVIGEYVRLKRAGRNFKGLSPFSQEKTPSFMVSPDKHIWHDFSSGKGGDVFSFIMEVEGIDFRQALELLARKAGVDLNVFEKGPNNIGRKKERLFAALELAAKYYQLTLIKNKAALDYVIKKRGLNKSSLTDFRLGYAPNSDGALLKALKKQKFTEGELRDAGLVVSRRFGPGDMFRARIMVPLMDAQGRIVGFTARVLTNQENAPKYINTAQTLLYDKSRHIFGLHLAKEAIRQAGFVVVVEGNPDVISSHQVGVRQVVATAGTALTEHHLRSLSRFTQDVRLAFDADKAGVAATERAIAIASNLSINLSIINIATTGAKDPDELVRQDPDLWKKAIDQPIDAVEWLLDIYSQRYNLTSAEGKRRASDQALSVVQAIDDPVLVEHYINKIAQRLKSSPKVLQAKMEKKLTSPNVSAIKNRSAANIRPDKSTHQDHLLALTLKYPILQDILKKLSADNFSGETRQIIADSLINSTKLLQSDEIRVKMQELELIAEAKYSSYSDETYFTASTIAKNIKMQQKVSDRSNLKLAFTKARADDERKQLSNAIKKLDQEIESLKS